MKKQHCSYLAFVWAVIKACKAVGVDSSKIRRTVPCMPASSALAFLQAAFLEGGEQPQEAPDCAENRSRPACVSEVIFQARRALLGSQAHPKPLKKISFKGHPTNA